MRSACWALGHHEPDLFRVYTFLAQVDSPLQHSHRQYLFEDPLFANFSRQDNAKEIVARYRKTCAVSEKKKNAPQGNDRLFEFCSSTWLNSSPTRWNFPVNSFLRWPKAAATMKNPQCLEKLLPAGEKMKDLFINLWLNRCRPEGLARKIREFDFLQSRLHYLQRASAHPAARKKLLAEFENHSPGE